MRRLVKKIMLTFLCLGDNIKIKYKEYPKIVEGKPENTELIFFVRKRFFPQRTDAVSSLLEASVVKSDFRVPPPRACEQKHDAPAALPPFE